MIRPDADSAPSRRLPGAWLSVVAQMALPLASATRENALDAIGEALPDVCALLSARAVHVCTGPPGSADAVWQTVGDAALQFTGSQLAGSQLAESKRAGSQLYDGLPARLRNALHGGSPVWTASEGPVPEAVSFAQPLVADDLTRALWVPLRNRTDDLIGAVVVEPASETSLPPGVQDMLELIAFLFSSAVTRHRASRRLPERIRRQHQLLEEGSTIVFELDERGVIRYVSSAVASATGYYPAEVVGRPIRDFLHPDDKDRPMVDMLRSASDASTLDGYRIQGRNGKTCYFQASFRVVQKPGEGCIISGVASDVTKRRQTEKALQAEKAFIDQATDRLPGLFYLVNHNLRLKRCNRKLADLLDISQEQVPDVRLTELFDFRMRPFVHDQVQQAFLGTTNRFRIDVQVNGEPVPHMFTAAPVDVDGERFVVGMGLDVSELEEAQRRLVENFEALRQIHTISTEASANLPQKIRQLLKSGSDFFNADGAVLARIRNGRFEAKYVVGTGVPDEGDRMPLRHTLCGDLVQRPAYQWPRHVAEVPTSTSLTYPSPTNGWPESTPDAPGESAEPLPVSYVGIPVHVDGELWGTLSFVGRPALRFRKTEESSDYLHLLARWIGSNLGRIQTQTKLRQSQDRFRALFAAAPDAYLVIEPATGRIADCNDAATRLLDCPRDHLMGLHHSRLHSDAAQSSVSWHDASMPPYSTDADDAADWLARTVEHGTWREENVPLPQTRSRDTDSPVLVDISARHVTIGTVPQVLAVFRDVTQRKHTEQALADAARRNQAFNKQLRTLVRVSTGMSTTLTIGEVSRRVVAGVLDLIPEATRASLWMFTDDKAQLLASDRPGVGCLFHGPVSMAGDAERGESVTIPLQGGILSSVRTDILCPLLNDVRSYRTSDDELGAPWFDGVQSLTVVPILVSDGQTGALIAESEALTDAFQNYDQVLMHQLAAQGAVALSNAYTLAELRSMSGRLIEAQEDERQRLAQELHDESGGLLTSLQFKLQEAQMRLATLARDASEETGGDAAPVLFSNVLDDPDAASSEAPDEAPDEGPDAEPEGTAQMQTLLAQAKDLTSTLSDMLRRVQRTLRPKILDDLGLPPALRWLVKEKREQTGMDIRLSCEIPSGTRYARNVETAVFRIVQEALTNVAKYANVSEADVLVNVEADALRVHVIDEGDGFDVKEWRHSFGETLGLSGMIERAEGLGGSVDIASDVETGTRITATLPIHPTDDPS